MFHAKRIFNMYRYNQQPNIVKHYTIVDVKNHALIDSLIYHMKRSSRENRNAIAKRYLLLALDKVVQMQQYRFLLAQLDHFKKFNEVHLGMNVFNYMEI